MKLPEPTYNMPGMVPGAGFLAAPTAGGNISLVSAHNDVSPLGAGNPKTVSSMSFGAAAANRSLIVCLTGDRGAGGLTSVTTLTLGGESATSVENNSHSGAGRTGHTAIWSIPAGSGDGLDGVTSGDVVITGSDVGGWIVTILNITGLGSLTATDTDGGTSTTAPAGSGINCNANGIIIGVCGADDSSDGASTALHDNLDTEVNDATHDGGKFSMCVAYEIFGAAQTGLVDTCTLAVAADSASISLASFSSA